MITSLWYIIRSSFKVWDSSFNVVVSFSGKHVIESFIMDVVINSSSHDFSEGSNLFYKDVNNPFKVLKFSSSSVLFKSVEFTEGGEGILSINDGFVRLSGKFPG